MTRRFLVLILLSAYNTSESKANPNAAATAAVNGNCAFPIISERTFLILSFGFVRDRKSRAPCFRSAGSFAQSSHERAPARPTSVHPIGNAMSHSSQSGFRFDPPIIAFPSSSEMNPLLTRDFMLLSALVPPHMSFVLGVGKSGIPPSCTDPHPIPLMSSSHGFRR